MQWHWWCIGIAGFLIFSVFLTAFICFYRVFYSPARKKPANDEYEVPEGDIYEPFRAEMIGWVKMTRTMPHEDVSVKSFDGLTLRGRYYECKKGAPIELQFHGYRGSAERDLSGGVERCFALDRNIIMIDQRAHGESDGRVISFGINERRDCLAWIDFAIERFGKDVQIIITGISMGGATVLMAAGEELPENVIHVLADCPYSSPKEIIVKVIAEMNLPAKLLYPFVKFGARVFGGFDLEEASPIEAVKKSRIPIIFVHGDTDAFVPFEMSLRMYNTCSSEKKQLIRIAGAGHGLAYPVAKEEYVETLRTVLKSWGLQ